MGENEILGERELVLEYLRGIEKSIKHFLRRQG